MSVAFVGYNTPTGTIPTSFGATTTAGDQVYCLLFTNSEATANFSMNGTTSTMSNVLVSGSANFSDGTGNDTYSLWATLSCAGGSETFNVTQVSGDSLLATIELEFSGGVSTKNAVYTTTANPSSSGALGQSVQVATGDVLVAICFNTDVFGNSPVVSTGGSNAIASGFNGAVAVYWNGTGASIQPNFTAAVGDTTTTHQVVQWIVSATPAVSSTPPGQLPLSGPGISPDARKQFFTPKRDTSAQAGVMHGISYGDSIAYGLSAAAGHITGQSYSEATNFGQLVGTGNLPSLSYSVSTVFGLAAQPQSVIGYIPKGGPGISPSSLFQFSSLILDESILAALGQGISISDTAAFGMMTGIGGISGQSYAVSIDYHTSFAGVLNGQSYAVSTDFGRLIGTGALSSESLSTTVLYGGITGLNPGAISYGVSEVYGALTGLSLSSITGISYGVSDVYGSVTGVAGASSSGYIAATSFLIGTAVSAEFFMPNLVGLDIEDALDSLETVGFANVSVNSAYSTVNPPNIVIAQVPLPGVIVMLGTPIVLTISLGPFVPPAPPLPPLKVTTRQFSLEEMVSREWGGSFRAPDHRIYNFPGRAFDSTDIGNTGIYKRGIDNPVPLQTTPPPIKKV